VGSALLDCPGRECCEVTGPADWPGSRQPAWADVLAWLATTDAIIHGLGHALNNRALAISSTIDAMDAAQPLGAELAAALTGEIQRLTGLLRALRSVPVHAAALPLPVLLKDVAATAIELHRHHASLGDVPVTLTGSDEAPPVLVVEPLFVHAMLVTLTSLKRFAGPGGAVRVTYGGTAEEAQLTMAAWRGPSGAPDGAALDGAALDGAAPDGAALDADAPDADAPDADAPDGDTDGALVHGDLPGALLWAAGLEVEQMLGRRRCSVLWALPSLREARRRARAAAAG